MTTPAVCLPDWVQVEAPAVIWTGRSATRVTITKITATQVVTSDDRGNLTRFRKPFLNQIGSYSYYSVSLISVTDPQYLAHRVQCRRLAAARKVRDLMLPSQVRDNDDALREALVVLTDYLTGVDAVTPRNPT